MIIKPLDLLATHVTLREFVVIPESPTSGGWFLPAGDFNGDGRLDLFIADHGWDALPYPGGQS
jgi:hypothetical protein